MCYLKEIIFVVAEKDFIFNELKIQATMGVNLLNPTYLKMKKTADY